MRAGSTWTFMFKFSQYLDLSEKCHSSQFLDDPGHGSACFFPNGHFILCGNNFSDKRNCYYYSGFPHPEPTTDHGNTVRDSGGATGRHVAGPSGGTGAGAGSRQVGGAPPRHQP